MSAGIVLWAIVGVVLLAFLVPLVMVVFGKGSAVSGRTKGIFVAAVVASAGVWGVSSLLLRAGQEFPGTAVSDIGEFAIVAVTAVFVMVTALRWDKGDSVRNQWLLVGASAAAFAVGDLVWSYYELMTAAPDLGEVPYPGIPDIFYLLVYPLFAAALLMAALGYRRLVDVKKPLAISGAITVGMLALMSFAVLRDIAMDAEIGVLEKAVSLFYPAGDVILHLAPALFIVFVVSQLAGGKLSWPWIAVSAAVAVIAVSDSAYSYMAWQETYASGNIIDMGWMLGYGLLAVAASLARDVYET